MFKTCLLLILIMMSKYNIDTWIYININNEGDDIDTNADGNGHVTMYFMNE